MFAIKRMKSAPVSFNETTKKNVGTCNWVENKEQIGLNKNLSYENF